VRRGPGPPKPTISLVESWREPGLGQKFEPVLDSSPARHGPKRVVARCIAPLRSAAYADRMDRLRCGGQWRRWCGVVAAALIGGCSGGAEADAPTVPSTPGAALETTPSNSATAEPGVEPSEQSAAASAAESAAGGQVEENPGTLPVLPNDTATTGGGAPQAGPAEPAPVVDATNGTGGPVGPADLTSATGLSFKIDAPEGNTPRGLLILLHGSTASNYTTFIGLMRDVARQYDLIPVSVLAPNGQGWNEGNQVRAADRLNQLIEQDLYRLYNVDKSRILFSGQSSGGGFLSSNFVPAYAQNYQGGAFFQCGAAPPNLQFAPNAETRSKFRLHFEITTGDPIWPESYAASVTAYTRAQMLFTTDNTKPGGHCAFDQQQVVLDHIDFVLGK
jgi:predicted esterase